MSVGVRNTLRPKHKPRTSLPYSTGTRRGVRMGYSKDVEISCEVKRETDKALLIFDGTNEVWIPKSQIKDSCEERGRVISIFIPEWLAEEKDLI